MPWITYLAGKQVQHIRRFFGVDKSDAFEAAEFPLVRSYSGIKPGWDGPFINIFYLVTVLFIPNTDAAIANELSKAKMNPRILSFIVAPVGALRQ